MNEFSLSKWWKESIFGLLFERPKKKISDEIIPKANFDFSDIDFSNKKTEPEMLDPEEEIEAQKPLYSDMGMLFYGDTGMQGYTGVKGDTGIAGCSGVQGDTGCCYCAPDESDAVKLHRLLEQQVMTPEEVRSYMGLHPDSFYQALRRESEQKLNAKQHPPLEIDKQFARSLLGGLGG